MTESVRHQNVAGLAFARCVLVVTAHGELVTVIRTRTRSANLIALICVLIKVRQFGIATAQLRGQKQLARLAGALREVFMARLCFTMIEICELIR